MKKQGGKGQEIEIYELSIIKNIAALQYVNNQEHTLSNAILEMRSKVILIEKKKNQSSMIFLFSLSCFICTNTSPNYTMPTMSFISWPVPQVQNLQDSRFPRSTSRLYFQTGSMLQEI